MWSCLVEHEAFILFYEQKQMDTQINCIFSSLVEKQLIVLAVTTRHSHREQKYIIWSEEIIFGTLIRFNVVENHLS